MFVSGKIRFLAVFLSLLTVFSVATIDTAEARRGGSFGSRGTKTFQTVPPTNTSPSVTAPVNRTMTNQQATQPRNATTPIAQRPGGLFGGGLLQGLFLGGLFGMFLGHGFGGVGGMLSLLFQLALIGGLVWFFFGRRRMAPASATAGGPTGGPTPGGMNGTPFARTDAPRISPQSGRGGSVGSQAGYEVTNSDLDVFESRLGELQDAFSREDYGALRAITTPEMMGYLSEELGSNASQGLRNEVFDVKMLGGSVAEAWREGDRTFVTVAMRYESRDITRERSSGRIVSGDDSLSETTEIWTFVRERGGDWKLSAIQDT
jgi:predicted lipid-binding transport protein (Tim44 family)